MIRARLFASIAVLFLIPLGATLAWGQNPPTQPPTANAADPYAVPSGNSQVLAAFLLKLMQERPQNAEEQTKIQQAALKAADKILASKPSNDQLMLAVKAKSSILQDPKELAAFETEMKQAGKKVPARIIHVRLLTVALDQSLPDAAAFRKQLEEVKKFFEDKQQVQPGDEQLAMHAAETAERTGDQKLICETYEDLAKLLPAQQPFSLTAKQMQACARRWNLPGNTMRLEGKTLEGKSLNSADYRGKVVLVDFWATWCGPCKAEIPNIKQNYTNYHDKGFEVVGISLDTGPSEKLVDFVKKEEVPWTICRDIDSPAKLVEYYGIRGIPTMILIGRDGKVVSLNARGAGLGSLVEKALAASPGDAADKESGGKPGSGDVADSKKDKANGKPKADDTAETNKKAEEAPKILASASRTWTDASGKFKVTAKFRGIINKKVKLECNDGRVINLPLEKLSDDDQAYIKKRKSGA
jgi:thiol-disulfide isomerase/thioredoxin